MAKKRVRRDSRASVVTATQAAKNFGELVDRVRDAGVAYVVERKGRPIARIAPVAASRRCSLADLTEWFERRRALGGDYAAAVADHVKIANRPRLPTSRWPS